ncbi:MAG: MFS transporter, partial [Candidatus Heimdallarchaeota archaeon]
MTGGSATEKSFKLQLLILSVAVAIVNTGFGIIFPIFPKLLVAVDGGNAFDLGLLAAAFGIAYMIGAPIFGNISDRVGKRKVILTGLLGFSFSNFIYILSTSMVHLYMARVVEGFFAAAILPPAIALTSQLSPKENRGRYLGVIGASQTTGIIIGPLLGGVLFEGFNIGDFVVKGSLTLPFYASAIIGMIAFVWSYIQLSEYEVMKSIKPIINPKSQNIQDSLRTRVNQTLKHQIQVLPTPLYMFLLFVFVEMLSILAWLIIEPGFVFY